MIRYALKCADGHGFESWFGSAAAFEGLRAGGHLECPVCGSAKVEKALMAPRLGQEAKAPAPSQAQSPAPAPEAASGAAPNGAPEQVANPAPSPTAPPGPAQLQEAMAKLQKMVEANSDYVGRSFAQEARAIHEGDAPERAIHGEANAEETRSLLQDGIPVLPLPFRDRRGTN